MKLIVACDPNGGIGYKNKLPWSKIQGDLPRFRTLTTGQTVIMGRNTWDSLPKKPLPNRTNIVITSRPLYDSVDEWPDDVLQFTDINFDHTNCYLIGGAKLLTSCWDLIETIYLTKTFAKYTCDCFIDLSKIKDEFTITFEQIHEDHVYQTLRKK